MQSVSLDSGKVGGSWKGMRQSKLLQDRNGVQGVILIMLFQKTFPVSADFSLGPTSQRSNICEQVHSGTKTILGLKPFEVQDCW